MREELEHHARLLAERLMEREGLDADSARSEAARRLRTRALSRELNVLAVQRRMTMRMMDAMSGAVQDVRYGVRVLLRRRSYAAAVLAALGIGIGGAAVTLALIDAIYLRPLPVPGLERVVQVYESGSGRTEANRPLAWASFVEYRAEVGRGIDLAAYRPLEVGITHGETVREADAAAVSWNYFRTLGQLPYEGRFFDEEDERDGAPAVIVIGHDLWRSAFAADPAVVGQTVRLGDHPVTVIGVAPPGFRGTRLDRDEQVWFPPHLLKHVTIGLYSLEDALETRFLMVFPTIARLPAGTSPEQLTTRLAEVRRTFRPAPADDAVPEYVEGVATHATEPLRDTALGADHDRLTGFLALVAGLSIFTLLVGTLNAMQLRFAHLRVLLPEVGVRRALGASTWRLLRQLLADAVPLVVLGTLLGFSLSRAVLYALTRFTLPGGVALERLSLALDWTVFASLAAVAALAVLAAGLLPAWRGARSSPVAVMRGHRRVGGSLLIGAQVALSTGLVLSGALFVRSFLAGLDTPLGFEPEGLVALTFSPAAHRQEDVARLAERIHDVAVATPGAGSVALAAHVPLSDWPQEFEPIALGEPERDDPPDVKFNVVLGSFPTLLGIPLLEGRDLDVELDRDARTAVLNQAAAEALFPGQSPLGRFIRLFSFDPDSIQVVGVVANARAVGVAGEPPAFAWVDVRQYAYLSFSGQAHVVARPDTDPSEALGSLGTTLARSVPEVSFLDPRPVTDQVVRVLMPQHLGALLFCIFGLFAAALAATGVAGVISFELARRRREIAIRAALGADWTTSVKPALRRSSIATITGLGAGILLTAVTASGLERFLLEIPLMDPLAVGVSVLLLGGATAAAASAVLVRTRRDAPATVLADAASTGAV